MSALWIRDGSSQRGAKRQVGYYLSNIPHFLWLYRRDNPREMLGEHLKSL